MEASTIARSVPARLTGHARLIACALAGALSLLGAGCAATRQPPPDYTVVAKDERMVGQDLRYYVTHVVNGAEREVEVKSPCFALAEIGAVIPATTITQYRDVTVEWKCR